jgi:very-short-patch-repair endonuclease
MQKYYEDPVSRKKTSEAGIISQNRPEVKEKHMKSLAKQCTELTNIEIKLGKMIKSLGIEYSVQKPILLETVSTVVDAFINPNICIYVDGCYHHSCLIHHPNNYEWRRKYDSKQTEALQLHNYVVLRFWEHEINEYPEKVKEKILEVYKNINAREQVLLSEVDMEMVY